MPRSQRVQCKWRGCSTKFADEKHKRRHEAEPHTRCVCGRHATTKGLKSHQRSCSVYQHERDQKLYSCAGCSQEIVEGMHYIHIPEFSVQTRMPTGSQLPASSIADVSFCTPTCLAVWLQSSELMLDVFDDQQHWDLLQYEVFVDGARMWYTISVVAAAFRNTWADVRLGEQIKLPHGEVRMLTPREREGVAKLVAASQAASETHIHSQN